MRLKELLPKKIIPKMMEKFPYENRLAVPKIQMVVINTGISAAKDDPKLLETASKDLALITGQKPVITMAKKAISGFKLKKRDKIGLKVTLRGQKMYDFLERLNKITLPRIRDFRGLKPSGFDGHGNYTLGIKEQTVFPEIKYDKAEKIFGLQITIKINNYNDQKAQELLTLLGFPFQGRKAKEK